MAFSKKMTDVNIATEMMMDAFTDTYDTALLISGDTDLIPPINAIRRHFPGKDWCVLPPNNHSLPFKRLLISAD
ncbi:MAG: NYN domain-containing protein [Saprospirales bacterium]|nr:NYN domain-containing protein [Saprospirales bacterium]